MPNRFIDIPALLTPSYALDCISLSVPGDAVDISIVAPDGLLILNERFYPFDGLVQLSDISSLIEDFMADRLLALASFTLNAYSPDSSIPDDSATLNVIFCNRQLPTNDWLDWFDSHFLSSLSERRISSRLDVHSALIARKGESLEYDIFYHASTADGANILNGVINCNTAAVAADDGIFNIDFDADTIIPHAAELLDCTSHDVRIHALSVVCGRRSLSLFVDPSFSNEILFSFRNCFNIPEFMDIPTNTSMKSELSVSHAISMGIPTLYDRQSEFSFSSQTAPLSDDEALWITQLFNSHNVQLICHSPDFVDSNQLPILITDADCKINLRDPSLNAPSFSWIFASSKTPLELLSIGKIFTAQYNHALS